MNIEKPLPQYKFMVTANEKGVYAIRMVINRVEFLAEPYMIFNTLFCKKSSILFYLNEDDYCKNKVALCVETEHTNGRYCDIRWYYKMNDIFPPRFMSFVKREYLYDVKNALCTLKETIEKGLPVIYNDKRNHYYKYNLHSEISGMIRQITNTKDMLLLHYPRQGNVTIEEFGFNFIESYSCDTAYEITLGDRRYRSALSDWSNELEHIRYMIESIAYKGSAEIELRFEDEPTKIFFKEREVRTGENTNSNDDACRILQVSISPDGFVKGPILHGFCRREQAVRALYQGLLKLAMWGSNWFSQEPESNTIRWDEYRKVIYNKLKSPIIEDYINKQYVEEYSYRPRQREIKRIFTINPDFDIMVWDDDGCTYSCHDDTLELCVDDDENYVSIKIPGIYEWQQEFDRATDFTITKTRDDFDWVGWHQRGIELAKQLREKLPPSCDLWYDAPYEDKTGTIKEKFLVI